MKKFIYCLLPLFCLQLSSCSSTEAFSLEAIQEIISEEKITEITGFKNRVAYNSGYLNEATSATYKKGLLINSHVANFKQNTGFASGYTINDYEYDKNGLLTLEKVSDCDVYGEVKKIKVHTIEYDKHKNPIKDRTYGYEPGEIVEEDDGLIIKTSYDYNKNGKIITIDEYVSNNGEQSTKQHTDFFYDKKQRLVKAEKKRWSSDFDDPDGYNHYAIATHTYKGNQITTINETIDEVGSQEEEKMKSMIIREYDSKHNPIHSLAYIYDTNNLENIKKRQEEFFEYNSKGLETLYKSYASNDPAVPLSQIAYRNTTYCGPNNDKIDTRIIVNNSSIAAGKIITKYVRNYYDSKQRAIKQEILDNSKGGSAVQMIYLFEY